MAGTVNKVTLLGNIGRDPEVKSTTSGKRIVNVSLATSENWTDKGTGEKKERTEWHHVVIFNDNLVSIVEKYVHKGSKIYIEGQLQTRKWTDQAGVERYSTEVVIGQYGGSLVLLSGQNQQSSEAEPRRETSAAPKQSDDDLNDTIPF